jgi:hypothetical protein
MDHQKACQNYLKLMVADDPRPTRKDRGDHVHHGGAPSLPAKSARDANQGIRTGADLPHHPPAIANDPPSEPTAGACSANAPLRWQAQGRESRDPARSSKIQIWRSARRSRRIGRWPGTNHRAWSPCESRSSPLWLAVLGLAVRFRRRVAKTIPSALARLRSPHGRRWRDRDRATWPRPNLVPKDSA